MDALSNLLCRFDFIRTSSNNKPWVIVGVPGAGKTTLLRELIKVIPSALFLTFGKPGLPTLEGNWLRDARTFDLSTRKVGQLLFVDEFQLGDFQSLNPDAIFGDVCQGLLPGVQKTILPSWIKKVTHRVPKAICLFLFEFGFEINSEVEGSISFGGLFEEELEGKVLTFCPQVASLLSSQGADFSLVESVTGLSFEVVTLCLADSSINPQSLPHFVVACTRAEKRLTVLTPDASRPSRG